jgi:hypothetical protein
MRKTRLALFGALAFSLAAISAPAAQQSDKPRKQPKQTHDTGVDGATTAAVPQPTGERNVAGTTVTRRANGVLMATLDESFEDALVAVKNADGTTSYTCLHGGDVAATHVDALKKPVPVAAARAEEK